MTKFTFDRISTLVNAPAAINGIITQIETALDTLLSRDGTSPNQMLANLDMNSNRILNLPVPSANTEPARLIDIFNYLSFPSGSDRETLLFKRESAPTNQVYWRLSTGGNGEPGLDLLSDVLSATPVLSVSRSGSTPTSVEFFAPLLMTNTSAPVGDQTALWRTDNNGTLIGGMYDDLGQEWQWLSVGKNLHVPFAATYFVPINVNTLSNIGVINFNRTNAPGGTPGPLQAGDYIGQLNFQGYAETKYSTYVSGLGVVAEEDWTDTANGAAPLITATPSGTTTPINMMLWSTKYGVVSARVFDEDTGIIAPDPGSPAPYDTYPSSQPTLTLARQTTFTGGITTWDANTMWVVNTVGANNAYSERGITVSLNNYSATGMNNLNGALIGESVKYGAATNVSRTFGTAGICWDATGRLDPTNMCAGFIGIFGYSNATPTTDANKSIAGLWLFADGAVPGQHVSAGIKLDFFKDGIIYDNGIYFTPPGAGTTSFVNGINFGGATFTGDQIVGNGWSVDPAGKITASTLKVTPAADPGAPTDGQFWANVGAFRGRLGSTSYTFGLLEAANTWTGLQTFTGGVTISGGVVQIAATYVTTPVVYGGAAADSTLNLYSTGGAGTTDAINLYTGSQVLRWKVNTSGHLLAGTDNAYDIGASGATRPRNVFVAGNITIGDAAALVKSSVAMNDGAGAGAGTITNAPAAGNPTKWIPINDNGTTRYIPAW